MREKLSQGMLKLARLVIKLKIPIILLVLSLTVFFAFKAKNINIDSDIINSLPESDPEAKLYKEIGDKYEGNSSAMIILRTDNVFDKKVLQTVKQITDSLKIIKGVNYVTSLTNIIDIKTSDWGFQIGKLLNPYDLPENQQEMDSLRNRVFEKDMYRGVIVSEDSTSTVIIATISQDASRDSVVKQIKAKINKINPSQDILYTGIPFMMSDVQDIIVSDLFTLLPITAVIIILILFFSFRSWRGVLMPLLTVIISIIWTLGIMAILNYDLTVISDTIPIVLLALGSAYTIHVLNRINKTPDKDRTKALVKALAYITVPVFLAFITTSFGFLSFVFGSYLTMIKDFGIFTAVGILIAFLLSVTFTPCLISLTGMFRKEPKKEPQSQIVKKLLKPLAQKVMKNPKKVVFFWILIALIATIGIFFIERKVDMVSYFKKDSPTRIAQNIVDNKLGGASPFYLIFKGDVQSPEFLKYMSDIEDFLIEDNEYVDYTLSVADLVSQMNNAMGEGYKIPEKRDKVENLWMFIESEDVMPQLVNYELTEAVIQGRFASLDSKDTRKFVENVNKYLQKNTNDNIEVKFTGMPSVYNQIDISLINSQLSSLALAIALMLIIVSFTLWSFKDGLLSIIPLLLTITISFGFMGLSGIPLDIATVLVASVTLGVGIDYAVHIVSHYRNYFDETKDIKKAVEQSVIVSGNAIFINVLAVAFGFIVFLMSKLVPLNNFGLLMALSMFVSGFSAVTVLPALIILLNNKKSKKKLLNPKKLKK